MHASLVSRIVHPLIALVTVNTQLAILKRNRVGWLAALLISILPAIVIRGLAWYFGDFGPRDLEAYEAYSIFAITWYMQLMTPILALMFGLSLFSSEYENETAPYLLLRPVPRVILALGKFLGYLMTTTIFMLISMLIFILILETLPNSGLLYYDYDIISQDLGVLILALAGYGSVLMFVGSFFRYRLLIGIIFLFGWETTAAYIPGSAHQFTLRHYLLSIFPHQFEQNELQELLSDHPAASSLTSLTVLLVVVIAGVLLTSLVLKYRELPIGKIEAE